MRLPIKDTDYYGTVEIEIDIGESFITIVYDFDTNTFTGQFTPELRALAETQFDDVRP